MLILTLGCESVLDQETTTLRWHLMSPLAHQMNLCERDLGLAMRARVLVLLLVFIRVVPVPVLVLVLIPILLSEALGKEYFRDILLYEITSKI